MLEAQLIESAQAGERRAQAQVLGLLQDRWYRMCLSLLGDAEQARDATQETALRVLRQIRDFRGESQFETWSLGIAINVARELRRRAMKRVPADAVDEAACAASPADDATLTEESELLREQLKQLPERQREAVTLRYFEGLSTQATAAAMSCSEGTVKATLHQALRVLRTRLKQLI
jgi:RNA polymerase sigma-70 factor (ECF subfamily)